MMLLLVIVYCHMQLACAQESQTSGCACAATTHVSGDFSHEGCGRGIDMTQLGFEDRDWCDTLDPTCIGSMGVAGSDYCTDDQAHMGLNCAALATDTLALPACSVSPTGATSEQCSLACAEAWLGAAARCSGQYSSAFEAVAPSMNTACLYTASLTLATAPRTVTVSGSSCYAAANVEFTLQVAPMNRRPLYATADGSWYMYWVPNLEGVAVWLIDPNLQTPMQWSTGLGSASISLTSAAEMPPAGSAMWAEACSTAHGVQLVHTRLELRIRASDDAAQAPSTVLDETVTMMMNDFHDFKFVAEAGTRYQLDVRVGEVTLSTPCSTNALDNPATGGGKGACDDAISSGQVTCKDDLCAQCGPNAHLCDRSCGFLCGEEVPCTRNAYEEGMFDGSANDHGACDTLIPTVGGETDVVCPGPIMGHYDPEEYGGHQPTLCEVMCVANFCPACPLAHYCDRACNFMCPVDGITSTALYVLPPGATKLSQGVASESISSPDKGIAFTAAASGLFTTRLLSLEGSGPVTITIIAVGTALERSPLLQVDGAPHRLSVNCQFTNCDFHYNGVPAFDGDSHGFDLVIPGAQAGRAYAITAELPLGHKALQLRATFYQPKAAAGSAGFQPVLAGPLGNWTKTPPPAPCTRNLYDEQTFAGMCELAIASGQFSCASDFCAECGVCPHQTSCTSHANYCDRACGFTCEHQSLAEYAGCTNDHVHQCSALRDIPEYFGIHPGGKFGSYIIGTWVAPASGAMLLRIVLNCDSVVYADVQAGGCTIGKRNNQGARTSSCGPASDGTFKNKCSSELLLTVTSGAYFSQDTNPKAPYSGSGHRRVQAGGDHLHHTVEAHAPPPTFGIAQRTDRILVQRADIEAQIAAMWQATPADQRMAQSAPSADELLASGTPSNAMLASLFTVERQPYVIYPLVIGDDADDVATGGHRRVQQSGDTVHVTLETHAPSLQEAARAEQTLRSHIARGGSALATQGTCDLPSRTNAVNAECCNEVTEDCSSGHPATCNSGCAAVVIPFFEDCSGALGKHAADFDSVVAMCHAALDKGRRLQQGGDHLHETVDMHAVCGLGSMNDGCTAAGQTVHQTRLVISRDEAEALARDKFSTIPAAQRTMASAPTLDEMRIGGTSANALLSSLFIQEQQPALIHATGIGPGDTSCGSGRRLQASGDKLTITVDTHAATSDEAIRAVHRLADSVNGIVCTSSEG